MAKGKKVRQKGKIRLSSYFKKIDDGDRVAVVRELSVASAFPKRIQGMSGVVAESRGRYKVVKLKDGDKMKTYIIHPVHLKKL